MTMTTCWCATCDCSVSTDHPRPSLYLTSSSVLSVMPCSRTQLTDDDRRNPGHPTRRDAERRRRQSLTRRRRLQWRRQWPPSCEVGWRVGPIHASRDERASMLSAEASFSRNVRNATNDRRFYPFVLAVASAALRLLLVFDCVLIVWKPFLIRVWRTDYDDAASFTAYTWLCFGAGRKVNAHALSFLFFPIPDESSRQTHFGAFEVKNTNTKRTRTIKIA